MKRFDEVKAFLDTFLDSGLPGFDCLVYHKGQCVLRHSNGYANWETKESFRGNERYNIYSCSKPITATAALMLYERGLLELDAPLAKYIPEFAEMHVSQTTDQGGSTDGVNLSFDKNAQRGSLRKAKNPITIRQLFCMKAGFSYDMESPSLRLAQQETQGRCPTVETIKYLAKEPLVYEPGETFFYSLAHDVLAAVVEVVSGQRFGEFVKENIFDPLGMKDSTFCLPDAQLDTVAEQYELDPETRVCRNIGKQIRFYKLGSEYESGGAGCVSTTEDYVRFLEGLRCGKLLKQETIDLMTTPHTVSEGYVSDDYCYGLGVRCPKPGSDVTDFGWGGYAGAYLAIDREHEYSLYYSQHTVGIPNDRYEVLTKKIRQVIRDHS